MARRYYLFDPQFCLRPGNDGRHIRLAGVPAFVERRATISVCPPEHLEDLIPRTLKIKKLCIRFNLLTQRVKTDLESRFAVVIIRIPDTEWTNEQPGEIILEFDPD